MRASLLCRGLIALLVLSTTLLAGPRDMDWEKVAAARAKDQPQTAIAQLQSIQTAAFAGHAWPEGVRALALRIILAPGNAKASHFFLDRLPPGTHVFETSVRIQHAGLYQTGTAEIRCLYAPEFNAHSGSLAIEVAP